MLISTQSIEENIQAYVEAFEAMLKKEKGKRQMGNAFLPWRKFVLQSRNFNMWF